MNNEEISDFESRTYLSPTKSRDEQMSFVDNLRETMGRNTAQINADTYALGTQVPSNLGGLSGAENTFTARYQTPQLNQTAADLRTAAQQTALNQALSNLQNAWKKRYNDAVLNYQKRAATANANNNNNNNNSGLPINTNSNSDTDNLAVRENEEARKQYDATNQEQLNQVMADIVNQQNSGNFSSKNSAPFMYKLNGQNIYGTIYRDALGRITGVSTPSADYNASGGQSFLQNLARQQNFYNANGQLLNEINALFGM